MYHSGLVPSPFALLAWEEKRALYPMFFWRHTSVWFSAKCLWGYVLAVFARQRQFQSTPQPCSVWWSWRKTFLDALVGFYWCHLPKVKVCRCSFARIDKRKQNPLRASCTNSSCPTYKREYDMPWLISSTVAISIVLWTVYRCIRFRSQIFGMCKQWVPGHSFPPPH